MNTVSMASYQPFQKFHPLTLLAQYTSRQTTGCLQVTSGTTSWFIYLEQGKLIYASNSKDPFGRLDRHLRQLSAYVPTLVSAIRVQVRLLFETGIDDAAQAKDYQAICWLVNQQHLNTAQAATLIEGLAKEVIESFLAIGDGTYELVDFDQSQTSKFCQLDLRPIVEYCQNQLRLRQNPAKPNLPAPRSPLPSREIALPASTTATNSEEVSASPVAVSAATPSRSLDTKAKTNYTIACIDDSQTVLQAIKSFLDDTSFSVLMINDPVKALMQIMRHKPDLILLDIEMPNLDGYELCSLVRRHPNFRHTPIIMVTGSSGFVNRAKAKLVRASGYLTKPFTQSDLLKLVFKHLPMTP
ncbi:MAG TPA: response regulator [Trichocoleus sp.]|jgi:twitching motility two-component system response regulator PilG